MHVIVWDLDGTLGRFEALQRRDAAEVIVHLRAGLREALVRLAQAGFTHRVSTLATRAYAEAALGGCGVRDLFSCVEGSGERPKGDAAGIAADLRIPAAERAARLLFVGDRLIFDEPQDPRVLFYFEPALLRPAAHLERLITGLRQAGRGSFARGFARLSRPGLGERLRGLRASVRGQTLPASGPREREVRGIGRLVLYPRDGECPVVGFAAPPEPPADPSRHTVPSPHPKDP